MRNEYTGPEPTLANHRRYWAWFWIYCAEGGGCHHSAPMAVAPLIIRLGADAPFSKVRRLFRCTRCGGRKVVTMVPSQDDYFNSSGAKFWFPMECRPAGTSLLPPHPVNLFRHIMMNPGDNA
jgi:hypothetical protein